MKNVDHPRYLASPLYQDIRGTMVIILPGLDWSKRRQDVSSAITAHVRSLQPSCDPIESSWHETIFLYSPIVLDDFTAYLTTRTHIRGWRRATKVQTKEWNKELKEKGEDAQPMVTSNGASRSRLSQDTHEPAFREP